MKKKLCCNQGVAELFAEIVTNQHIGFLASNCLNKIDA
ncbi:hypothetical protein J714_2430 [Acinetobacter baumannii 756476]|nr:hypothetical protein M214_2645 [Acinetobacter baumannii CI86]EXC21455.1 hypothetical protein J549_2566 [Acinetobacter baumannii 724909]EXR45661.1 hypothetical protein J661_3153 [Acinetobacter baumannii 1391434]KCY74432.1 hypothetical protein J714_2430 [Acinetobacter baumannii 756476]